MPITFTALPVKRRFGKIRRFSRIANYNKIPLIMPRATRRAFQIVLLHASKKNRTRGHGYGSQCADQAVSSTLFLPVSSFCLKRPLALKPGMEVDSSWLETLVLGLV